MTVEIRELIIRAETTLRPKESEEVEPQPVADRHQESPDDREALIQECVRQVLRILQKTKER